MSRGVVGVLVVGAVIGMPGLVQAGPDEIVLLPTTVSHPVSGPRPRRPDVDTEERLARVARQLDFVLGEAVQDLGLTLELPDGPQAAGSRTDAMLVTRAAETWVLSPEVALERGSIEVKLTAVAPGSTVLLVRREAVDLDDLELETMRMLRDLVQVGRGAPEAKPAPAAPETATPVLRAKSRGRAVLALSGAILGGYVGYSVQRASGSTDVRLTYPLTALGTGVGLGASMIVADEWDVGVGDAWYLAGGMAWSGAGALLLSEGYDVRPTEDRYLYGMLGATSGLVVATTSLAFGHVDEGGAALTQSGGAFGTLLGGLVEAAAVGSLEDTPTRGMGYGALGGVVVAGAAATGLDVTPSRVLFIDLLAGLGGLVGAAVASPVIVGDTATEGETRGWLLGVATGTLAGAAVGVGVTRPREDAAGAGTQRWAAHPYGGVVQAGLATDTPPALGIGIRGVF